MGEPWIFLYFYFILMSHINIIYKNKSAQKQNTHYCFWAHFSYVNLPTCLIYNLFSDSKINNYEVSLNMSMPVSDWRQRPRGHYCINISKVHVKMISLWLKMMTKMLFMNDFWRILKGPVPFITIARTDTIVIYWKAILNKRILYAEIMRRSFSLVE